jgi:hypothetical protein
MPHRQSEASKSLGRIVAAALLVSLDTVTRHAVWIEDRATDSMTLRC